MSVINSYFEDMKSRENIMFIDVPYEDRGAVKALGAWWSPEDKKWYCHEDCIDKFSSWIFSS